MDVCLKRFSSPKRSRQKVLYLDGNKKKITFNLIFVEISQKEITKNVTTTTLSVFVEI